MKVPDYDYQKITVPTKKTTLLTNPTTIYGKEPVVFETLEAVDVTGKAKLSFIHHMQCFPKKCTKGSHR